MLPSQLIELGQQALTDVRIGVANGEPLVRCQLLASEFYESLKRALRAPDLRPVERFFNPPRPRHPACYFLRIQPNVEPFPLEITEQLLGELRPILSGV